MRYKKPKQEVFRLNPQSGMTAKGKRMYRSIKKSGSAYAPSAVVYGAAKRGQKGLVTSKWAKEHDYPKPNPPGARELGSVGDTNPIEYGGGYIFSSPGAGGPWVEWYHGLDSEDRELGLDDKVKVYRADLHSSGQEFLNWYNWADWDEVAESVGADPIYFRASKLNRSAAARANAVLDAAGLYGWENFDQYPLELTLRELMERWDYEVDDMEENPPVSIHNTEIHTWFERDRAHVNLVDEDSGETLVEWWDEDVQQAVEDGFLDPKDWHGSAVDYYNGFEDDQDED